MNILQQKNKHQFLKITYKLFMHHIEYLTTLFLMCTYVCICLYLLHDSSATHLFLFHSTFNHSSFDSIYISKSSSTCYMLEQFSIKIVKIK